MNFKNLYKILDKNKYYVFSFQDILSFFPTESEENLKKIIYRWKKARLICHLKRGLYELSYPKDFNVPDMYIANVLYSPSYVSLETALSNFSIIPETAMAVTSVTTSPTRKFKNKHGLFIYRTIKINIFTGYYVEKHGNFSVLIAEPEKALVDYFYFKKYIDKNFDLNEERFDKDVILSLDRKKMNQYAKLYNIDLKDIYAHL
jgi:predicted transcriptional regulator of viral defense system